MLTQWLGTALLVGVAGHGLARLVATGPLRASDAVHVVMALGLAAMLYPPGEPIPGAAWEALFVLLAAGCLVATLRDPGWSGRLLWARHAVAGSAMVYMFAVAPMAMSGGGLAAPALTWALVAYFGLSASWSALRAAGVRFPGAAQLATSAGRLRSWVLAPRAVCVCDAVMAGSMALMLLAMR